MATVLRKTTSKFWFAAFRDATGRQHRKSTGTTDKASAKKIAERYQAVAQRRGNPEQVRKVFAELYKEFYGAELPTTTVRTYSFQWLEEKRHTEPSTFASYEKATAKLLNFLGPDADRDLASVTKPRLVEFRSELDKRFAPATVNFDLGVTRMIFRSARVDGYRLEDPAEGIKPIKNRGGSKRRPFTIPEIQAVLSVADPEWQSMVKFGLYTGQRLGDIARLSWDNVDFGRNELRMVSRKTNKTLILPLAGPLREHLLTLPASEEPGAPIHPNAFATLERQGRVANLSNQFNDLLAQAGLRPPARPPRSKSRKGRGGERIGAVGLGFHCLRHTAVSLLKDAAIPDAVVMELVGHSSRAMSQRYTHVGRSALTQAVNALPEL